MKMNRCLSLLIAFTIICGPAGPALSQDKKKQDEDVIKISAQLVQVDVIVYDKDNNPVGGLKREDFELYDNDKPQNISFFSYEHSKLRILAQDADEPRSLPRVVTPTELRRVVAFVVDTLHMSFESIYRTRKMLREFIDTQMEPGDLVLILPTGGGSGLFQQFTADQRLLRRAVSHLRQTFILDTEGPARRGGGTSQAILSDLPALPEARQGVPQAPGQGGLGAGASIAEGLEEADARATITALNGTIQAMAKFPGRKIGVFISEGLRVYKSQVNTYLTETTYRAARANVVFYSIDPQGLQTLDAPAGGQPIAELQPDANSPTGFVSRNPATPGTELFRKSNDIFESQEALNRLAVETGGKFYRNNNDIKRGLVGFLKENSAYYLLGFQPEESKWDGKFHKLKIVVKGRPDLTVTTRKGYLAKAEKPASREAINPKMVELQEAFYSPLVRRDIDVQLTPYYRDDTKREPVLTSMLHIDASRMSFKQVDGLYKNKLVMTGLLIAGDGKVVDSFSNTLDLNYQAKDYEAIRKDGLLVTRTVGVKPGGYQVRVLVREPESGAIGTANSFIDIPELKAGRLAVSSIFTDAQLMQQDKAADAVSGASTLSQRRFSRGAQFAYVMMVYNAKAEGGKTQLEISSRLLRNGELIYKGQPKPVDMLEGSAPPSRIITGGILQLANLPPDDYVLEVTITDKLKRKDGNVARQEIDFSVE